MKYFVQLPKNINITYAHLPNGDRIMREFENETGASTTFYLYDREDRIGDYDINGNLLISYTHGPGIDEPVAMTIIGGGKVSVPGPRPPIVGPLPMKYLWHSFYTHIKAVSPWS